MTTHRDVEVLQALARCTFLPGSAHKRFVRDVAASDPTKLTWRQWAYVRRLAWRYRRQMPARLVPRDPPPDPPPRPPKKPRPHRGGPAMPVASPPVALPQPQMELL